MRVTALDGTDWEVTRRAHGYSITAAIIFVVLTIVGWVVAIVFALPAVLFVLELAALLVLALVGRREYVVTARSTATGDVRSEKVRGRRRSRRAERALARELSGYA